VFGFFLFDVKFGESGRESHSAELLGLSSTNHLANHSVGRPLYDSTLSIELINLRKMYGAGAGGPFGSRTGSGKRGRVARSQIQTKKSSGFNESRET
jgi:hypothetical protein